MYVKLSAFLKWYKIFYVCSHFFLCLFICCIVITSWRKQKMQTIFRKQSAILMCVKSRSGWFEWILCAFQYKVNFFYFLLFSKVSVTVISSMKYSYIIVMLETSPNIYWYVLCSSSNVDKSSKIQKLIKCVSIMPSTRFYSA